MSRLRLTEEETKLIMTMLDNLNVVMNESFDRLTKKLEAANDREAKKNVLDSKTSQKS